MRIWRFYGNGTIILCLVVLGAREAPEWFAVLRVLLWTTVFHGPLRAMQRRATNYAFREMGLDPQA